MVGEENWPVDQARWLPLVPMLKYVADDERKVDMVDAMLGVAIVKLGCWCKGGRTWSCGLKTGVVVMMKRIEAIDVDEGDTEVDRVGMDGLDTEFDAVKATMDEACARFAKPFKISWIKARSSVDNTRCR